MENAEAFFIVRQVSPSVDPMALLAGNDVQVRPAKIVDARGSAGFAEMHGIGDRFAASTAELLNARLIMTDADLANAAGSRGLRFTLI
jgi:hypothetical protein